MSFGDNLEKRFGFLAVNNAVLFIILGQILAFGLILLQRTSLDALYLSPAAVIQGGEYWRLLTFVICPPWIPSTPFGIIFLAFYWYIFWFVSGALESEWGLVKLNFYLLVGIVLSIVFSILGYFVSPNLPVGVDPQFLYLSVFLAFATLNPNVEFLLFFILPVKVKWLAWLAGGLTFLGFIGAPSMGMRLVILGSVLNYLLFFGPSLVKGLQRRQQQSAFKAKREVAASEAFHICQQCGADDKTHPEREFRYKSIDGEPQCLCEKCRASA